MAPLDPEAVADERAALGDVPEWWLPAPQWDRVASILEGMATARDTRRVEERDVRLGAGRPAA